MIYFELAFAKKNINAKVNYRVRDQKKVTRKDGRFMINVLFIGNDRDLMKQVLGRVEESALSQIEESFVSEMNDINDTASVVVVLESLHNQQEDISIVLSKGKLLYAPVIDGRWEHPKNTANELTRVIEGIRAKLPREGEIILISDCIIVRPVEIAL